MGWMIVFAWDSLTQNIAHQGIVLLVVGGVLYTIGAVFYVWRGFRFHHMHVGICLFLAELYSTF